ncbi:MAG: hypothetical protein ACOC0J_01205 [Myxococcota bacterium]
MNSILEHTLFRLTVMFGEGGNLGFMEKHGGLLLPLLAVLMLILLVAGVVSAWKTPEIAGAEKARLKGEIIRTLRSHIGWMTAQEVADRLEIETHTAAALMNEMQQDGVLVSGTMEGKLHYRVKST